MNCWLTPPCFSETIIFPPGEMLPDYDDYDEEDNDDDEEDNDDDDNDDVRYSSNMYSTY